jgi:hypothetical protein
MPEIHGQTTLVPIVSILGSPEEPVREDGNAPEVFTFKLSEPAPVGGLKLNIVAFDSDGIGGDENLSTVGISNIEVDPLLNAPISLTIEEGATIGKLILTPIADNVVEGTESSYITLLPGTGYTVNPFKSTAQTSITDTQVSVSETPIVSILGSPEEPVREDGNVPEVFTFKLSEPAPVGGLKLNIVAFDSDGIGGDENLSTVGISNIEVDPLLNAPISLTIEEGATIGKLILTPIADNVVEGTESSYIFLKPGTGYTVNPSKSAAYTSLTDVPPHVGSGCYSNQVGDNQDKVLNASGGLHTNELVPDCLFSKSVSAM